MSNSMVKIEKPNNFGGYPVPSHNHICLRYAVMTDSIITKICSKCKVEKPLSEFHKQKLGKYGVNNQCKHCIGEYYEKNKERLIEKQHKYYENNREKCLETCHAYRMNNKKRTFKNNRDYYKANKEQILSQCKGYRNATSETRKAWFKEYAKTEKRKATRYKANQKYKALKRNATIQDFSPIEVLKRDGYICQLCRKKTRPDWNQYHSLHPEVDHIIPLSKGGDLIKDNVQALCVSCNSIKGNRPMEYLIETLKVQAVL